MTYTQDASEFLTTKKEEEETGAEIIQIQIDTIPATSIFGVYLETSKPKEDKEHAHKMLQKRVDKCIKTGTM